LNTNNIGGFNISNFKMRYLNEFLGDVVADWWIIINRRFNKGTLDKD
jgi:hypothetical protein